MSTELAVRPQVKVEPAHGTTEPYPRKAFAKLKDIWVESAQVDVPCWIEKHGNSFLAFFDDRVYVASTHDALVEALHKPDSRVQYSDWMDVLVQSYNGPFSITTASARYNYLRESWEVRGDRYNNEVRRVWPIDDATLLADIQTYRNTMQALDELVETLRRMRDLTGQQITDEMNARVLQPPPRPESTTPESMPEAVVEALTDDNTTVEHFKEIVEGERKRRRAAKA
jgi:hypothetical protein